MDAAFERTGMPCFYLFGQRVSGDSFQFMSRMLHVQTLTYRTEAYSHSGKVNGTASDKSYIYILPKGIQEWKAQHL